MADAAAQLAVAQAALREVEVARRFQVTGGYEELRRVEQRARRAVASYRIEAEALVGGNRAEHIFTVGRLEEKLHGRSTRMCLPCPDDTPARLGMPLNVATSVNEAAMLAEHYQEASAKALSRAQAAADQAEEVAIATGQRMKEHDEQLDRISADLQGTKASLKQSKKLYKQLTGGVLGMLRPLRRSLRGRRSLSQPCGIVQASSKHTTTTPEPNVSVQQKSELDEFSRAKGQFNDLLDEAWDAVVQMHTLIATSPPGDARARGVARLGSVTSEKLEILDLALPRLQRLLGSFHGRGVSKGTKVGNATMLEVQTRYQDLRTLKRRLYEIKNEFAEVKRGDVGTLSSTLTRQHRMPLRCGTLGSTTTNMVTISSHEATARSLHAEEQEALAGIKRRDKEVDCQLTKLGGTADRLTVLAAQIGMSLESQRIKVQHCFVEADDANLEMAAQTRRIRQRLGR